MASRNKAPKIILLFGLLLIGFVIFLSVMLMTAVKPRDLPSRFSSDSERAKRGDIISADGFHIASTQKLYKAVVNTRNIDPEKRDLFVKLFSIYSGMQPEEVERKLRKRKGSVVLSYHISPKTAQYLKTLAFELRRLNVFIEYTLPSGRSILHGLNILESGETREYPYGKVLTPVIGYPRKMEESGYTKNIGVKGVEKQYDDLLAARQDEEQRAPRDVNSYMILNKESVTKMPLHGYDIRLNIPVTLQIRVEKILDHMKAELDAQEVLAVVMESQSGKVRALASSNRFLPKHIKRSDYPSLNTGAIEYSFEPGSVLKPLVFAMLMEKKLVNPFDLVNGHNGRYRIGRKVITDEHKFDWLSAENVIVHSSNVGIAQLAQKLDASDYYQGLLDFGFTQRSGIDLPYEKKGDMPSLRRLNSEIYKATTSYGYGMRANLVQLIKAYNCFNNSGRAVTPQVTEALIDERNRVIPVDSEEPQQILSTATAERMKKILVKTVNEGTGVGTKTEGLEIGGKTGTAHIAEKGRYVNKYNSSFIGFANDAQNRYTIAVTVVKPKKQHFASLTAVATFKKIIDMMVEEAYLKPLITELPDS
jgi:cell division protein FtsI (penicillin-binding protein 3)